MLLQEITAVTVTDARGCTYSGASSVTEPAEALTGSITSQTDITCEGAADGSVTVTGRVVLYLMSIVWKWSFPAIRYV